MNFIISDEQLTLLNGTEGHIAIDFLDEKVRLRVFGTVSAISLDLQESKQEV